MRELFKARIFPDRIEHRTLTRALVACEHSEMPPLTYANYLDLEKLLTLQKPRSIFLDNLPGPYFVLEQFGQIAACRGWALDTAGVADLTWGMVRRNFHRRGLGRELLRFRLNAIRNDGRATLVRVRTAQLVQGFFVREGFSVVDVVLNGFGAGLDKVTMEAVLPPNMRCSERRHRTPLPIDAPRDRRR
jgi:GNAT superfamily N-acetyltransferase